MKSAEPKCRMCGRPESEHWFDYGEWRPHKFEPEV